MSTMKQYTTVFVLLLVCAFCCAQVPGRGKCPDIQVKSNFHVQKYLGTWYEYQRFFAAFEVGGICGMANYTMKSSGHIGVLNMGINKWTKKATSAMGDAYAPDPKVPAKLVVSFPGTPAIAWILTRKRGVLDAQRKKDIYNLFKGYDIDPSYFNDVQQDGCPN